MDYENEQAPLTRSLYIPETNSQNINKTPPLVLITHNNLQANNSNHIEKENKPGKGKQVKQTSLHIHS